ncbi:hypothetical protein N8458_01645 [Synechococcus sp. AH-601-P18]|nr:hypothetical protein [Synechococcus sp. AH-601-P18]
MVDLSSNIAVLRRWSLANPGTPMPADFNTWRSENLSEALSLTRKDPELVALLTGTANAELLADTLQGLLSPTPVSEAERADKARKAEAQALYNASKSEEGLNMTQKLRLQSAFPELTKKVMQETTVAQPSEEEMVQQQRQQAAYQAEVRAASRARSMAAFGH